MRERVSDYIVDKVVENGAETIFFVPGSGCMFLIDALIKNPVVEGINLHHEQSAGMAALTYAQVRKSIGACIVTTGCGGTNAITALLHAYQDSIPVVFISGQVDRNHTVRNSKVPIRQFGRQETDIISIVEPICKYAVMLNSIEDSVYEIDKAIAIAQSGRPGPVWIDVPFDIQNAIIETDDLAHYEEVNETICASPAEIVFVQKKIEKAKRPVVLAGNGIKISNSESLLKQFLDMYDLPLVYSRLGHNLIDTDDEHSIGMVGMLGASRSGNFAIQNSDLVVCIGCRLSINTTGEEYSKFARDAELIVIDIDENEHKKETVKIDKFIKSDAAEFLRAMNSGKPTVNHKTWREKCLHWKKNLPVCYVDDKSTYSGNNMYDVANRVTSLMNENAIFISDAGDAYFIGTSAAVLRENQISITSGAQAEMGYALPGAVGAAFAAKDRQIITFSGDGSMMMNIQELATVAFYRLPIKMFVLNNNGYDGIRKTHLDRFRRYIGTDKTKGLGLADYYKLAGGFGIDYCRITDQENLDEQIEKALNHEGPIICDVICKENQEVLKVIGIINKNKKFVVRPLEDQDPFLPREVFIKEMIIEPIDQ